MDLKHGVSVKLTKFVIMDCIDVDTILSYTSTIRQQKVDTL